MRQHSNWITILAAIVLMAVAMAAPVSAPPTDGANTRTSNSKSPAAQLSRRPLAWPGRMARRK